MKRTSPAHTVRLQGEKEEVVDVVSGETMGGERKGSRLGPCGRRAGAGGATPACIGVAPNPAGRTGQPQSAVASPQREVIGLRRRASALILVQQEVRDALVNKEAAPRLGADQGALLQVQLQQRMVQGLQEGVVLRGPLWYGLWEIGKACGFGG